jgi:hypothetical protein
MFLPFYLKREGFQSNSYIWAPLKFSPSSHSTTFPSLPWVFVPRVSPINLGQVTIHLRNLLGNGCHSREKSKAFGPLCPNRILFLHLIVNEHLPLNLNFLSCNCRWSHLCSKCSGHLRRGDDSIPHRPLVLICIKLQEASFLDKEVLEKPFTLPSHLHQVVQQLL